MERCSGGANGISIPVPNEEKAKKRKCQNIVITGVFHVPKMAFN